MLLHLDIAHDLALLTNFQVAHLNEGVGSLSSPANAITPTPYNLLSGDVTLRKQFNRLTASVGFRTDSYDFGSARAQDGTVINQDARDGQIYSLHSRIDYAISSALGQAEAVRAGAGIGILHTFVARAMPELVAVDIVAPIRRAYWLVYHESVRPLRRVQAVATFITRAVERERALFV